MENTKVALIGIMVEDRSVVGKINEILSEYSEYTIGRMGLPYEKKKLSIITIVLDAPQDKINAVSGKIGKLSGVSTKTIYSNF